MWIAKHMPADTERKHQMSMAHWLRNISNNVIISLEKNIILIRKPAELCYLWHVNWSQPPKNQIALMMLFWLKKPLDNTAIDRCWLMEYLYWTTEHFSKMMKCSLFIFLSHTQFILAPLTTIPIKIFWQRGRHNECIFVKIVLSAVTCAVDRTATS